MATQTLIGFIKGAKNFEDPSSEKAGAMSPVKTFQAGVSIMFSEAEVEQIRQVEEKKFAEMQARYLDQIKVLEAKLKKRSEELSSFEMQVKLLQDANKVIQNEFEEREKAMARRESELKELMKQQEAKTQKREEELIELHKNEIKEKLELFEKDMAELEEKKKIEFETMKAELEKMIEDIKLDHKNNIIQLKEELKEEHEKMVAEIEQKHSGEIKKINEEHHKKLVEKGREFDQKVQLLQEDLTSAEKLAVQAKMDYASASIDNDIRLLELKKIKSAVNVLPNNMKLMVKRASSGVF